MAATFCHTARVLVLYLATVNIYHTHTHTHTKRLKNSMVHLLPRTCLEFPIPLLNLSLAHSAAGFNKILGPFSKLREKGRTTQ